MYPSLMNLYDQLSLIQFVQGFACNIVEASEKYIKECMISLLSELIEDVTDFLWPRAIAEHAILLCAFECAFTVGSLNALAEYVELMSKIKVIPVKVGIG